MQPLGLLFALLSLSDIVIGQQLVCENRDPEGHSNIKTVGDGTFQIEILGLEANTGNYMPNEVYTVTIKGLKTHHSTNKFLEFLIVAESEKQAMMGQSGLITTGIFHIVDDSLTRFSDFCPDGVTNSNLRPKSEISVLWTAPSVLVASCITFKATVVERPHIWYMDDDQLTKTLCPYTPPPPSTTTTTTTPFPPVLQEPRRHGPRNEVTKCCACDEAKYDVAFEGIWSKETHPKDFPENTWLLHFSDIIGASHSSEYYFWETDKVASEGIRHVAEWGATRILENELKAKSRYINTIIKARGLWYPNEKGQTTAAFRVDRSRHLMSLVTMIGPSPDWFVGLSGYDLCTVNCTWLEEAHFDLFPYDAGTDNGITYMSPNDQATPPHIIRPLTETEPNDTRSPFFYPNGQRSMQPFAKLHLQRQRIYPKSCENTELPQIQNHEIIVSENSEDVGRPECAVTEWSSWSDCSVICGKGLRMRKRSYLIPFKADMMRCDRQLEEKEMCLGFLPTCDNDDESESERVDGFDSICAVTRWSDWTPCDRPCGKGTQTRNRRYKNHMGRKKCSLEMTQTKACMGESEGCDSQLYSVQLDVSDPECPVTPWSEYSPCSAACGEGFRERTRFFLLSLDAPVPPKCLQKELSQNTTCMGEYGSCEIDMAEAKEICMLLPDVGPCRFHKEQFFFNIQKGMCLPMQYGGCKGNRNRFDTEDACVKTCGFLNGGQPVTTTSERIGNRLEPVLIASSTIKLELEATTMRQTSRTYSPIEGEDDDDSELLIKDAEEPIDCVVSRFSEWSICLGDCGELGYMTRSREIIIEPRDGKYKTGKKCPKHFSKQRVCRVIC